METYLALQDKLSNSVKKTQRNRLIKKITKLRKDIFKENKDKIDRLHTLNETSIDDIRVFENLPFGHDVESMNIMSLYLNISLKYDIKLDIDLIYSKTNKILSNLVYSYLEKWEGRAKASEYAKQYPVDHKTKVHSAKILPISKDSVKNIISFLKHKEFNTLIKTCHWFYDLKDDDTIWKSFRNNVLNNGVIDKDDISDREFVISNTETERCVFCKTVYSKNGDPPVCTNPVNVIHPGTYCKVTCAYCRIDYYGGNKECNDVCPARNKDNMTWEKYEHANKHRMYTLMSYKYRYYHRTYKSYTNISFLGWSCCDQIDNINKGRRIYNHPQTLGCRQNICTVKKIPKNIIYYRKLSGYDS